MALLLHLREENPALRFFFLWNWTLQCFVTLSSKACFNEICCTAGMWATTLSVVLLAPQAFKAMQYWLHLQSLFPSLVFPSAQRNQHLPLHYSSVHFSLASPPFAYSSCAKLHPRHTMNHSFPWYSSLPHVRLRAPLHMKFSPKWSQVQVYIG